MSVKKFDELFGLKSSIEEEQEKFVNRIQVSLFDKIATVFEFEVYKNLFEKVCILIGVDSGKMIREASSLTNTRIPNFSKLTEKDFQKSLRIIVAIYQNLSDDPENQDAISEIIQNAIDLSPINLGIKWRDGLFYPTGDKILDKELIDESLEILIDFPNERIDLQKALDNYTSKSLYGVVENCYLAIEGLSRKILNNNKTLIDNKPELVKLNQFSAYWNKIFANYMGYANDYRRHAGECRHDLRYAEVESFLYLSCLIIRATVRASKEKTY